MGAPHWIGSVRFELRSSDSRALEPVRRALREEHDRMLVGPLQRALDLADRPTRAVRRRRIEVDLGLVDPKDLGSLLERRIAETLRILLGSEPDEYSRAPGPGLEDQLIAFLENGHLGWPSPGKALEAICIALEDEGDTTLVRLAGRLERIFRRRVETVKRFTRQCLLGLVVRVAGILTGSVDMAAAAKLARHPAYAADEVAELLAAMILRLVRGEAVREQERQCFEALIGGVPAGSTTQLVIGLPVAPTVPPAPDGAQLADSPTAPPIPHLESHAVGNAALPAALCLDAAGTVLLHPFIAVLFGACGLLDEKGRFSGEEERCRAVLLLQFAATGVSEAAEPELALAKLLCGVELESPVPRSIAPSSVEVSEIDAMLRAAINHWSALGDSSPEALRETFLKRSGRLIRKNDEWRLEVEAKGVDILIDSLPWPISLVLTPFMTRPLAVDWR